MKLAASHIAWAEQDEPQALALLRDAGFAGLEIAPTRVAGPTPYRHPRAVFDYARMAKDVYGLSLCSMQSLWYGQTGSMFGPERAALLNYTRSAITFAAAGGIGNLVFGSPKNRVLPAGAHPDDAVPFFRELGNFALAHHTTLSLEANPPLYGTNFITTTPQALAMVRTVGSPGFQVNLDFGTIIENDEPLSLLEGEIPRINHVHISEPNLVPVQPRPAHRALAALLRNAGYTGYVSLEMKAAPLEDLKRIITYLAEVFG